MTDAPEEAVSDRVWRVYDDAEQAYIRALGEDASEAELARLAHVVASAAESSELTEPHLPAARPGIDRHYDVPEVLSTLWVDIAAAYERRAR